MQRPGESPGRIVPQNDDPIDRVIEPRRERQCLPRELVFGARHEDEDHDYTTPSSRRIPTTAGAASAPWPSTSTCLPEPGGKCSRTISRRGSGRTGVVVSTGLRLARSLPGTDGYR